jgi:very-short-patch-repair endonuclease
MFNRVGALDVVPSPAPLLEKVPKGRMRSLLFSLPGDGFPIFLRLTHMTPTPLTYARAKAMRSAPTEAERKLWGALRKRSLGNSKFVRQQPIGPYIVDFVCRAEKIIIEVDGATHGEASDVAYDIRRTQFLKSQGYRVVRVDNQAVFTAIGDALDYINGVLFGQ